MKLDVLLGMAVSILDSLMAMSAVYALSMGHVNPSQLQRTGCKKGPRMLRGCYAPLSCVVAVADINLPWIAMFVPSTCVKPLSYGSHLAHVRPQSATRMGQPCRHLVRRYFNLILENLVKALILYVLKMHCANCLQSQLPCLVSLPSTCAPPPRF